MPGVIKHDGLLNIAIGGSRKERLWKNKELLWSDLVQKLSHTTRTTETYAEYQRLPKTQQDEIKDVGGFVGGVLKDGRRKADTVVWRQVVTLDADFVKGDLWAGVETLLGCSCAMYSTHKHNPNSPRLRLLIPLLRPVSADEYQAVARRMAADLGIDFFDDTTYQPHRLMYWPSTCRDGEFVFKHLDAPWLDPQQVLDRYQDWQDSTQWPVSSRTNSRQQKLADKQGNPREKTGVVGAFCRTYNVVAALEQFLSDVYARCTDPNRYTYIAGSTTAGLVIYGEGDFAYSHHGTDPAGGRLCNAFDLVRLHRFGELDEEAKEDTPPNRLPSCQAMLQLVIDDPGVKKQLIEENKTAADDFADGTDWSANLEFNSKGLLKPSLSNIQQIARHDPELADICYNEHRDSIDVKGKVPWKRLKDGWGKTDEAGLVCYLEDTYKIWSPSKCREALLKVAVERSFHPVRDYILALPPWDGVARVDTLLIDYLGAADDGYVRAATRKTLVAAVARAFKPGTKFDSMLVLNGPQGIGKSTLFAKLGQHWFSDSLAISDMKDKTAAEKLQGCWIMEIGELAGLKKTDIELVKAFLSRQDDMYRASYGYNVESHRRQCVLVGSTNNEAGFLRDITGNRRFWPVKVSGNTASKPWQITETDQIWAEALVLYQQGEPLYMESTVSEEAEKAQIEALEVDEREGLIREYLDTLLPENWDQMDLFARRNYLRGDQLAASTGTVRRQRVCTLEIWCELFGKDASALRRLDAYELNAIMNKLEEWERYDSSIRIPLYGKQRMFMRKNSGTKKERNQNPITSNID